MKDETDCLFCGKKWKFDTSITIGKKQVCNQCLERLADMMKFFNYIEG